VKYFVSVLDANGATAESLRRRVRAATARIDGNGGRRGTGKRHGASRGGTLLRYIRIVNIAHHDVVLRPISRPDTKTINDLDLLFMTRALAKIRYTEGKVRIPRSLLRIDSLMLYKKIRTNRLIRTLLNMTPVVESEVVRDRSQRTFDNA
jgi:hypothetical protein